MNVRNRDERGSISLWLALASVAMVLCVGLAVDLGGHTHAAQRAHDLAAQAARTAGEQVAAVQAIRGNTPQVDATAARAAAQQYLTRAGVTGSVAIQPGGRIAVTVTDSYDPIFLTTLGIGRLPVTGTATARLVRAVDGTER